MQEQEFESVLKIHCCRFERGIFPWRQQRLLTPYWRFYWNPVRGGFLRFGDEIVALEPELFYVIPGYLEFSTFAEQPFEQFYIHFNLSDRQPLRRELYRLPADPPTLARIRAFIDWENDKEYMQLRQLAAISILSASLLRLPPELFRVPARFDPRIAGLCDWIRRHPSEHVSNDEFAARLHLNRNSFIRLFHAETGESPQLYCRRKRIELACELLHFSDRTIEEIAEATGFADRYHFSRVFSQMFRISPAVFRRAARRS